MKFTAFFFIMLGFVSALISQPEIMARWSFEQDGEDASGNGHTAVFRNGAQYCDEIDAIEGNHSLILTGSNYAVVEAFDLGDQFSITGWAFLENDQTNIQTIIGNCEGGSTVDGFKLFVNNWETANLRLIVEPSDGVDRIDVNAPEGTFEEAVWNHVAITVDRALGMIDIYYNGEKVTENNMTVTGFQTNRSLYIGAMAGPSWYWHGMLDDIRLYSGILTEDEIGDSMDPLPLGIGAKNNPLVSPGRFKLGQNYPNPLNASTVFPISLNERQRVKIEIVDVSGRVIDILQDGEMPAGEHSIHYDGQHLSSGMYLYRLTAGDQSKSAKMLLIK
ncbi:T9SS type A sorting domain-containing protein [candidate division KSB1 bacterium]|nr:T9SS type A sorting domain-containing protein [candidate division KSB1 bacterium]